MIPIPEATSCAIHSSVVSVNASSNSSYPRSRSCSFAQKSQQPVCSTDRHMQSSVSNSEEFEKTRRDKGIQTALTNRS